MDVREVAPDDRAWVEEVLVQRWGSTHIASRGGTHDAAALPALLAEVAGERVGLLTYREIHRQLEVVTLDALRDSIGVGTALLERVRELAEERHCSRVWLVTSNDNLRALRFYQRRGFRRVAVHVGAVDRAVLANLLQLYRHNFSPIRGFELTDHGTFVYRFLDANFTEPGRRAWFIRRGGRLAGFAMARVLPDGFNEVAEFFVARAHRRAGVGRRAAAALFQQRPGQWELGFDLANHEASGFWPSVAQAAAVGPVDRRVEGPPERTYPQVVLSFSTR
jgi:predicted acetyltransferase